MSSLPSVILCGPYPASISMGGIARWDDLVASSFLQERFDIHRLPITLPGEGGLLRRMWTDLQRTRRCLDDVPAPLFHLTSQYMRGTYREYLQYRLALSANRTFSYDIRGGCFIECYEDPRAPLRRRLLRAMLLGAATITVEGRRYVDWIASELGREAIWVPNIVLQRHAEEIPRAQLDKPATGAPLRIAFSGRLIEGKGLETLLHTLAKLAEQRVPAHLSILGSGDAHYEEALRRLVGELSLEENVSFKGALQHAELLHFLATQHIFAFPTEWWGEGHSNAVNEAMQVGLPIATTRQGFLPDVVTPECGVLVPSGDPEALASELARFAADWERLRAAGEAAHHRVYAEFSDTVALARLASAWHRALHQP